jgi:hypothetical protein
VTVAPKRPETPRAGRRGFDGGKPGLIEWLHQISDVCGECYGHRQVWCPSCAGFGGCWACNGREWVSCPMCSGGRLWGYRL